MRIIKVKHNGAFAVAFDHHTNETLAIGIYTLEAIQKARDRENKRIPLLTGLRGTIIR